MSSKQETLADIAAEAANEEAEELEFEGEPTGGEGPGLIRL